MIRPLSIALGLCAGPTQAANFYFCWLGDNGYSMTGEMTVNETALNKPIVTARDVTQFAIAGFRDGQQIGNWDLATKQAGDTWVLHFDPATNSFLTGDALPSGFSQGWNADGTAEDCGAGRFGFNSGNQAQDFCLDGVWIEESGVDPQTTFLVSPVPVDPQCRVYVPTS
ncbi:hypothetical protein [Yoonia sp. SS1-5]|uniref:DUF1036 domain-containing protein n=1 Tax=Yoonia rhodophyticola TaxID=3137370 RepID=A0AAN0NJM9_9RHOB